MSLNYYAGSPLNSLLKFPFFSLSNRKNFPVPILVSCNVLSDKYSF